jgi:predicted MPP superfamily phosphohydrolase
MPAQAGIHDFGPTTLPPLHRSPSSLNIPQENRWARRPFFSKKKRFRMLKILYMSDLHIEMERWKLSIPGWPAFLARHKDTPKHPARGPLLDGLQNIDLIVFAGDIHNGLRGIVYAEQVAAYLNAPAVYIAGNHEFYYHDIAQLLPVMATTAPHSHGAVTFLENAHASFIIRGEKLNVLGATLWTNYALHRHPEAAMRYAGSQMNDHVYIDLNGERFQPEDALASHNESKKFLHRTLKDLKSAEPDAKNLIVTHHAPSPNALGKRTGPIAPAYASDLLIEFAHHKPAAWIHGHTHFRHDDIEHGIRLVSAPRGYVTHDGRAALDYQPGVLEL